MNSGTWTLPPRGTAAGTSSGAWGGRAGGREEWREGGRERVVVHTGEDKTSFQTASLLRFRHLKYCDRKAVPCDVGDHKMRFVFMVSEHPPRCFSTPLLLNSPYPSTSPFLPRCHFLFLRAPMTSISRSPPKPRASRPRPCASRWGRSGRRARQCMAPTLNLGTGLRFRSR